MPLPSADQVVPFHRAMFVAFTAPAWVNAPPTYRLVPSYSMAPTPGVLAPVTPEPSACQLEPSHRAMLLTWTPPLVVNAPPTNIFVPKILMVWTMLFGLPPASGHQLF